MCMEFCRDGIRITSVRIVKQPEGNPEMNGDLVDSIVGFAEARNTIAAGVSFPYPPAISRLPSSPSIPVLK